MKPSKNPIIEELTKTWRERSFSLSDLTVVKTEGCRLCAWCAVTVLFGSKLKKYCSPECSESAMIWAYPQQTDSIGELLTVQNYKCKVCDFDFGAVAETILARKPRPYGLKTIGVDFREKYSYRLVKVLKSTLAREFPAHRPEVDHIVPIYKGGSPLDRQNLQLICSACHKAKTKIDNSGKRSRK